MKGLFLNVLISIFICLSFSSSAQDNSKKFSVSIGLGPSFPLGRFSQGPAASSNALSDNTGNAVVGPGGYIALQYIMKNRLGFSLLAGKAINKRNDQKLEASLRQNILADLQVSAETGSWKIFKLMPGVFYSILLSKKSKFEIQPMVSAGICKTAVPTQSYNLYKSGKPAIGEGFSQPKIDLPVAFCYQFAGEVKYNINQNFFLSANLAYFSSNPQGKYTYGIGGNNTTPVSWGFTEKKYSLSSLNSLLGVGVRF